MNELDCTYAALMLSDDCQIAHQAEPDPKKDWDSFKAGWDAALRTMRRELSAHKTWRHEVKR